MAASADSTTTPLRILVVEDDPTFRRVLELLFSPHWVVDAVPDAETALRHVRERRPHIVIADFRLPGMDGAELALTLRDSPDTCDIPVVMLSGVAGAAERDRALESGALDVLVKPVSEGDLRRRTASIARIAVAHRDSLEAAQRALREAEERFRLLVDTVREYAIFMLDPEGRVISWNRGAEVIKGWAHGEVTGRHVSLFYPEDAQPAVTRLLGEAAVTGSVREQGWQLRKDGSRFWAEVVTTALYSETGGLRGFARISRDLTSVRATEEERIRLLEKAQAANRAKEQFLATLSHELRTPLNAILGWVHLLKSGTLEPGKMTRAYEVIERNAAIQARLVEDILDVSRILAGRVRLSRETVEISALVG